MIPYIIKQWDKNKHLLRNYFETTKQSEYNTYDSIVTKLFELVIVNSEDGYSKWDFNKISIVDDGHYQGMMIFIIPIDTYQPGIEDYLHTHEYYGSCSGCDTLQSIINYSDDLPEKESVDSLMTLALHLVQNIKTFI